MEIEGIDWSQMPPSNWTIQTELGFEVSDTIAGLRRHLRRIEQMETVANNEIAQLQEEWKNAPNRAVAEEYGYDPVTDECAWAAQMERDSYGLLAVMISARLEKWYFDLCDNLALTCRSGSGKTNMDLARKNLKAAGIEREKLAGFHSVERTMHLAKKFKHHGGVADSELAKLYGFVEGEPIEYENQDWQTAIADVKRFLEGFCTLFRG